MQRILIKHLSGSKAKQTDLFELPVKEFTLGRDAASDVRYDPELDDLVSRIHAKIVQKPGSPPRFTLVDLNSRNGTFLNGVRVVGTAPINPDDHVSLGEQGPEFVFEIDPRPQDVVKATRFADVQQVRELKNLAGAAGTSPAPAPQDRAAPPGAPDESRTLPIAGAVLLLTAVAAFLLYRSLPEQATREPAAQPDPVQAAPPLPEATASPLSPAQIGREYSEATVFLQSGWKLVTLPGGRPLYHVVGCTAVRAGRCANRALPWYVRLGSRVEPYVSAEPRGRGKANLPIGGSGLRGTGFVAAPNGFILTSRQLAAGWDTRYFAGKPPPLPGYLVPCESRCDPRKAVLWNPGDPRFAAPEKSVRHWVPARTAMLGGRPSREQALAGRHTGLEVTFPKTRTRIPAQLIRTSERADLALLKVELPQPLKPAPLAGEGPVQAGDAVTLLGYPPSSPDMAAWQSGAEGARALPVLPDPTLSAGIVARVLGSPEPPTDNEVGETYQLDLGATGIANIGGPVFNDRGRVIGVFTPGTAEAEGSALALAVPIKYGQELVEQAGGAR